MPDLNELAKLVRPGGHSRIGRDRRRSDANHGTGRKLELKQERRSLRTRVRVLVWNAAEVTLTCARAACTPSVTLILNNR